MRENTHGAVQGLEFEVSKSYTLSEQQAEVAVSKARIEEVLNVRKASIRFELDDVLNLIGRAETRFYKSTTIASTDPYYTKAEHEAIRPLVLRFLDLQAEYDEVAVALADLNNLSNPQNGGRFH